MREITIGVSQLKVNCIVGCKPSERVEKQNILFDIKVRNLWNEENKDDITSTISYIDVASVAREVAEEGSYFILEVLASDLVNTLFKKYPTLVHVWVKITKPNILSNCEGCFIEYEKSH